MEDTQVQSPFVDVRGAAKYLLVPVATIYDWNYRSKELNFPVRHHGKRVVYALDELRQWSDSRRKNCS